MPELFVVRHAEPEMSGVMLGRTDPPLSAAGRLEARAKLSGLHCAVVYSSPLRRARETAEVIAAPVEVLDDLAEIAYGEWEGRSWAEIEQGWPDLARRKREDWFAVTPPGGESWEDVSARAARALKHVRLGPFPAVVVAHFGFNAEFLRQAAGLDPVTFSQSYCEVVPVNL
jgi:broad specificity phosphatase PhoE